jgi:hypothetical protein
MHKLFGRERKEESFGPQDLEPSIGSSSSEPVNGIGMLVQSVSARRQFRATFPFGRLVLFRTPFTASYKILTINGAMITIEMMIRGIRHSYRGLLICSRNFSARLKSKMSSFLMSRSVLVKRFASSMTRSIRLEEIRPPSVNVAR